MRLAFALCCFVVCAWAQEGTGHYPALMEQDQGLPTHTIYPSQPKGGEFAKVAVALLQWQLKGDKQASEIFVGADCSLCQDPRWHVAKKGIK